MRGSDYGKNDAYVDPAAFHRREESGRGPVRGRSDAAGDSQLMKSLGGYLIRKKVRMKVDNHDVLL